MRHKVVPSRQLPVTVFGVGIRERAKPQIPLIGVISIELKVSEYIRSLQLIRILETIAQSEGPVMMNIVAEKHVGGSCQLGDCLQRRVRVDYCHYHQPAGI